MASIWHHTCGGVAAASVEAVRRGLAQRGLDVQAASAQNCRAGPGLLLFANLDAEVRDALQDLSRRGETRVIALYAGEGALAGVPHWSLLEAGAADVIEMAALEQAAAMAAARIRRWQQIDDIVDSPLVKKNLLGNSPAWKRVLRQIVEVAAFTDANALIIGESGTGKELTARLMHTLDVRRAKGQLVVLDCTTVMSELAGSEFFGHERGAFTGATGPRDGAFALADGGTLFLDEAGELPVAMQPQLLRVIQERSYKRVGGTQWHKTDFRLVCATNRVLEDEVARGAFRGDLYWRIATCIFRLPPLRERPEDILPLARQFLAEALAERRPGADPPPLQEPVRDYLLQRSFPGNVRELRQLMVRIASRHVGEGPITVGDLPEDERPTTAPPAPDWRSLDFDTAVHSALRLGAGLRDISSHAADVAIRIAVGEEEGNLQRAARRLGVTDRALQMRRAERLRS